MMKGSHASLAVMAAALLPMAALADRPNLSFTKAWTYSHAPIAGQVSEIPAYDPKTRTLWIAGIVGVDVLDAATGALVDHIDTTTYGSINSVAITDGVAAFAIESEHAHQPGQGAVLQHAQPYAAGGQQSGHRRRAAGHAGVLAGWQAAAGRERGHAPTYGALASIPNLFPRDYADAAADPAGSVSIIDVKTRAVIATPGFIGVPAGGSNLRRRTGMDFEPEYIAVDEDGRTAYVTLQEANAIGVLDLRRRAFTSVIGLGAKDFSLPGNEIDPLDNAARSSSSRRPRRASTCPTASPPTSGAAGPYLVMANEGDFREDNVDRSAASSFGRRRAARSPARLEHGFVRRQSVCRRRALVLDPRHRRATSSTTAADSWTAKRMRAASTTTAAAATKASSRKASRCCKIGGRTYAFIGLERTLKSAVAIFDITNPTVSVHRHDRDTAATSRRKAWPCSARAATTYLAIANEVSNTTTVYRLTDEDRHDDRRDDRDGDEDDDEDKDR